MKDERLPNQDLQDLWKSQQPERIRMSLDQIREKAGKFERKIWCRNAREFIAAAVVIAFFSFELWRMPADLVLAKIGFGLIIAGTLYVVWHLHRRGSARTPPAEMGLTNGAEFFRRELVRQRDLLKSVWRWYLGPMVPGMVVAMVGMALKNPRHMHHYGWRVSAYGAFVALLFIFIGKLNAWAARRLQRQIDELDELNT